MIKIEALRSQHEDAMAMAQRLLELVERHDPAMPAFAIMLQVNRLFGLLRVHLANEDVVLYPTMVASPDPAVAQTARRFVEEMGDLATNLECFARHWSSLEQISVCFDEFREAVHDLMMAVAARIEREDRYLYPLAERPSDDRRQDAA